MFANDANVFSPLDLRVNLSRMKWKNTVQTIIACVSNVAGAQMAFRPPLQDYDEGTFRNPTDFWVILCLCVVVFVGPGIIANKYRGDESDITYWKYFIFTLAASFAALLFSHSTQLSLFIGICVIGYGLISS